MWLRAFPFISSIRKKLIFFESVAFVWQPYSIVEYADEQLNEVDKE